MDDNDIIINMVGTAFNVLLEQEHPDIDTFTRLMSGRDVASVAFDLRYRRADGEKL